MIRWAKRGLIYAPSGRQAWAQTYATLPTAQVLNQDVIRVYFAALNEQKMGRIGYVDVEAKNPSRIIGQSEEPVLDLGPIGTFDDSGVNPSCVLTLADKTYLYYIGWQRCERVPYLLFAGLAVSEGDGGFRKVSSVPVLDRTAAEPFLRSATSVLFEANLFKAWYVSGIGWTVIDGRQYPSYVIRYAESNDGLAWVSRPEPCITFRDDTEFGFGRPWVVREKDGYKMWYSIRSRTAPYRIGYAESGDGVRWVRRDDLAGIERSETGWDSEMICYGCVVAVGDKRYMFYNGNRHGQSGFGYAVLES